MKLLCTLIATATCLAVAGPASAEVIPEGTGEPAYTNSSQNTQFVRWQNATGYDGYRVHVVYYRDAVQGQGPVTCDRAPGRRRVEAAPAPAEGLKAGTYAVKIAFKPAGVSWSAATTAKVALRK